MLPHLPNRNMTQSHNILSHVLFMPALNTQKQKQKSKVQNDSILPLFVCIGVTISFAIGSLTLYHLCSDNLDKCIKQQYMIVGCKKPDSIHYFHSYAVADRVIWQSMPIPKAIVAMTTRRLLSLLNNIRI